MFVISRMGLNYEDYSAVGNTRKDDIQQKQLLFAFSKKSLVVNFFISIFVYYYSLSILNVCNILSSYKKRAFLF